jgi:hypothetical protein
MSLQNITLVSRLAITLSAALVASALAACGDSGTGTTGTGGADATTTTSTSSAGGAGSTGSTGTGGTVENPYTTAEKINAYLDGKTLTMAGADIPTDPNGYNENYNFATATQCYNQVVMKPSSALWHVESTLGTLNGAPNKGDKGTCDHAAAGMMLSFDSTAILIENVSESCFDFTATYVGFGQEGRGKIAADGKTVSLELYFKDQATGHRCADGAVGAQTVKVSGADFKGNAVQVYQIK